MKNLLGALLKAQKEFPTLVKDATNPAFRSRYATLAAVQEAAFPVLHKHGLIVMQSVRTEVTEIGLLVYVGATLYHVESGESVVQELGLSPGKTDPQGIGSAITYGRRYLLMTILGMAADDDDGNSASYGARTLAGVRRDLAPPLAQRPRPIAAPPEPAQPVAAAPVNGAANSTRKSAGPAVDRPQWATANEAIAWGIESGAFADDAEARAELRRILQSIYPGRESCKPHELPAVFDAWFNEVRRRQLQKA